MKARVLIAEDDPVSRMDISLMLEEDGYEVVGEAKDGIEAVSICDAKRPDIVLMDIRMPLFNGLRAAELIHERSLCSCILILTAYSVQEYVQQASERGIMGYLLKPVVREMLTPAIEISLSRSREICALKNKVDSTERAIEDRKLVERCKGLLMKKEGLTEEDAYKKLRNLSMDKRCSMAIIAKMLIMNEA